MKRKSALISGLSIAAIILLVSLAGCAASTTGQAVAPGQQAVYTSSANQQGIWVSGEGKVTVTPNIATLSIGVNAQASTVAVAQAQAATAMDKVITV